MSIAKILTRSRRNFQKGSEIFSKKAAKRAFVKLRTAVIEIGKG